jgi:hypothetical protein
VVAAKQTARDTMLTTAHAHLDWAEKLVSGTMNPTADDLALARVRIMLASSWIELGREQTP